MLWRRAHHGEGERTRVIGYCDPPGVWLVLANKSISGFLTARYIMYVSYVTSLQLGCIIIVAYILVFSKLFPAETCKN